MPLISHRTGHGSARLIVVGVTLCFWLFSLLVVTQLRSPQNHTTSLPRSGVTGHVVYLLLPHAKHCTSDANIGVSNLRHPPTTHTWCTIFSVALGLSTIADINLPIVATPLDQLVQRFFGHVVIAGRQECAVFACK